MSNPYYSPLHLGENNLKGRKDLEFKFWKTNDHFNAEIGKTNGNEEAGMLAEWSKKSVLMLFE